MNTPAKCFFVYQPHTGDFERIDFAPWPYTGTEDGDRKNERKLTQSDDSSFDEGLGTMEFEPITIRPA